jgi:hypothetical protein
MSGRKTTTGACLFIREIGTQLIPGAEVPDTEMVFQEDRAGHAETPDLFFVGTGRHAPCAEEFGWLELFEVVRPVVRAVCAVLAADCTVLLSILDDCLSRRYHEEWCMHGGIIGFFPGFLAAFVTVSDVKAKDQRQNKHYSRMPIIP